MSTMHAVHPFRRIGDLPFRIRGVLDASTGAALEGVVRVDEPDFGRRIIDLTECSPWIRLKVTVECDLTAQGLREVVATDEEPEAVLGLLLTVAAGTAKLRHALRLTRDSGGSFSGSMSISRDDVGSTFELGCRLVRTTERRDASAPGVAAFIGAILGEAEPVLFVLDKAELPYTGQVRFLWKNFADEPELRAHASLPLLVRTEQAPTVILNAGIPDLRAAFEGRSNAPLEAALRNTLAAAIGGAVWRQLTIAAIASVTRDAVAGDAGDGDDENSLSDEDIHVPADWKGTIARNVARFVYADQPLDEALTQLWVDFRNPEGSQVLFAKIGLFADAQARVRRSLDSALKAARQSEVGE